MLLTYHFIYNIKTTNKRITVCSHPVFVLSPYIFYSCFTNLDFYWSFYSKKSITVYTNWEKKRKLLIFTISTTLLLPYLVFHWWNSYPTGRTSFSISYSVSLNVLSELLFVWKLSLFTLKKYIFILHGRICVIVPPHTRPSALIFYFIIVF